MAQPKSWLMRQSEKSLSKGIMGGSGGAGMIQRDGESATPEGQGESAEAETTEGSSGGGGPDPVTGFIAGLLEDQLSNSTLRGHLRSLGDTLEELAEQDTRGPGDAGRRLPAILVSEAFRTTADAILADPGLQNLRQQIVGRVRENPGLALAAALGGLLVAALADVDVSHEDSWDVGEGFTLGGAFDFGSVQSLEFNRLQLYSRFASTYFRTQITNTLTRDAETDEYTYTGRGDFRVGTDTGNIFGSISINSEGEIVMAGRLTSGFEFGGDNQLLFTADLRHTFAEDETIFSPGVSGRFDLGSDQHLRLGASAELTAGTGLTGLTGFLQLENDYLYLRIDGSMSGLAPEQSMMPPIITGPGEEPARDMRIQGTLVVPFF